ncbi:MAG: ABC transporter permease [candidate division WOR-3 bacterium]
MNGIKAIIKKEFIEIIRDKRNFYMVTVAPFILLLLFGYIISLDLKKVETGYFCENENKEIREFIYSLTASGFFINKGFFEKERLIEEIKRGNLKMGIIFDKKNREILFLIDGSQGLSAQKILGYISKFSQNIKKGNIEIKPVYLFNPSLETKNYTVPGVFVIIVIIISSILTGISFTIEKERKTIEIFNISPLKPHQVIIGKITPYTVLTFIDGILIFSFAKIFFKIPFKGNPFLLILIFFFYILIGLGIGMLASLISKTQRESMLGTFLIIFPFILLSGIFFPIESMSEFFRFFTNYFNPVTHFLICLRSILLKGANIKEIYFSFIFLIIYSFFIFTISYILILKKLKL